MLTSYHNHTRWSDGLSNVEDFIAAARRDGVDAVGISDHYVLRPDGVEVDWAMRPAALDDYLHTMQNAAASAPELRIGVEADYFPETIDIVRARLDAVPLDYIIGSVHYANDFPIDMDAEHWEALDEDGRNAMWRLYWVRIREMAQSGAFDIVGHLDLPKKFGYRPTIDLTAEAHAALDAIAASGMAMELNTAGWKKPIAEAYPAVDLLQHACRRGIPLVITADAHVADQLTSQFPRARGLARAAGYTEVVAFEQRQRTAWPL